VEHVLALVQAVHRYRQAGSSAPAGGVEESTSS
jgi:hypothetical protein